MSEIPVDRADRPMFDAEGNPIPVEERGEPFPKRRGRRPRDKMEDMADHVEVSPEPVEVETTRVKVWASLGMTIQTAPFENQKLDMGVSGIPIDASDQYIEEQMRQATITLNKVVDSLAREMTRRLREDYGR
jgi:hypothetical protein